jgi:hypothetical protein
LQDQDSLSLFAWIATHPLLELALCTVTALTPTLRPAASYFRLT